MSNADDLREKLSRGLRTVLFDATNGDLLEAHVAYLEDGLDTRESRWVRQELANRNLL